MTNNVHSALSGTETESGLHAAFNDESVSHVKYRLYADAARRSGNEALARALEDLASHEAEHACVILEYLDGISDDATNLAALIASEDYAATVLYPELSDIAAKDGFSEISDKLKHIAQAEAYHSDRLSELLKTLSNPDSQLPPLYCPFCGCIIQNPPVPDRCPLCSRKSINFLPIE